VPKVHGDRTSCRLQADAGRAISRVHAWRRKIKYQKAVEVDVHPLIARLSSDIHAYPELVKTVAFKL
jgi:hypothetical protein